MKLINVKYNSEERIGILLENQDVRFFKKDKTLMDIIEKVMEIPFAEREEHLLAAAGNEIAPLGEYEILSPIVRPNKDILCVGLNYTEHIKESQSVTAYNGVDADYTTYFGKRADYIRASGETIQCLSGIDPEMDYEVELTVIIGKKGRGISKENALEHVFGYTVGNDLSSRTLQRNHKQWYLGKSLDGYTAMGPCVLLNDDGKHKDFALTSRIDGEVRQASDTKHMIKPVEAIIYELSKGMTLFPGDIIMTGTPAGVGMGFKPGKFMKEGTKVECEIEGIGILENLITEHDI